MATQPKKTNRKSPSRQKPVQKRKRTKRTKNSTFKKNLFVVLGVFLMISMVAFGYFLGQKDTINGHTPIAQTYKTHEKESQKRLLEELSKIKTQKPDEKKEVSKDKTAPVNYFTDKKEAFVKSKQNHRVRLSDRLKRPRLVIIIDDVSTRSQLDKIQATGLKLTPSIFPPSQRSMTSHTLARGLEHYMIHLPMESVNTQFNTQTKTLMRSFSKAQIEARVKEIRALFPKARYVNNHTGSVYTDHYNAMRTLYRALRAEGFVFVDSRTIATTKVPQITDEFGDVYVARDIFIDNKQNIAYIHQQLQKAVNKAKDRGYAIAIGHPHEITMKALSSAQSIFTDVELVYIDELYQP